MYWQKRLKDLREDHDLTRAELAEKLAISERTLSRYETGETEPTISVLIQLSLIYDVSIDYIAGVKDEMEIDSKSIKNDIEEVATIINKVLRDL